MFGSKNLLLPALAEQLIILDIRCIVTMFFYYRNNEKWYFPRFLAAIAICDARV